MRFRHRADELFSKINQNHARKESGVSEEMKEHLMRENMEMQSEIMLMVPDEEYDRREDEPCDNCRKTLTHRERLRKTGLCEGCYQIDMGACHD